ncbi:MAG TPA: AzlD domain-containing protein [Lactobacillaceae bacterium]|jgi:branched-subunit amino acid transport protein
MSSSEIYLLIIGLFLAAYLPRLVPIFYFSKREVPSWFHEWMKYVPITLFAALVSKDVFIHGTDFVWSWAHVITVLVVFGVAYKTRSMVISVIVGLLTIYLTTMLLG